MPLPEKDIVLGAASEDNRVLASFIFSVAAGTAAKMLISPEPFDWRRFVGEMILASLAGAALYFFGLMQGFSAAQMGLFGSLGGLGGIRAIEWMLKLAKTVRQQQ